MDARTAFNTAWHCLRTLASYTAMLDEQIKAQQTLIAIPERFIDAAAFCLGKRNEVQRLEDETIARGGREIEEAYTNWIIAVDILNGDLPRTDYVEWQYDKATGHWIQWQASASGYRSFETGHNALALARWFRQAKHDVLERHDCVVTA